MATEFKTITTESPTDFLCEIQSINKAPKTTNIYPEISKDNGNVVRNEREVVNRRKTDFHNLKIGALIVSITKQRKHAMSYWKTT